MVSAKPRAVIARMLNRRLQDRRHKCHKSHKRSGSKFCTMHSDIPWRRLSAPFFNVPHNSLAGILATECRGTLYGQSLPRYHQPKFEK